MVQQQQGQVQGQGQQSQQQGATQQITIPASALHHHHQGGIQTIQIGQPGSGNSFQISGNIVSGPGGQQFQLAPGQGNTIIGTTTINGQTIQIAHQGQPTMVSTAGGVQQQVHFTTQPQQTQQNQQQQVQIQAQIQAQVNQQIQAHLQQQQVQVVKPQTASKFLCQSILDFD